MEQLQSALNAFQSQDLDGAELILKTILAVNPKESNALHLLGCIYKERGQLQQAVELIQASIRADASNPIPFLNLGKIYGACGQFEQAVVVLKESLSKNQQIAETWFVFGSCLCDSGQDEKAVMAYRNVLQLDPSFAEAYNNIGAILKEKGEVKEAIASYRKAVEVKPDFANAYYNLGVVLMEEGEVEEAIASYRKAIELKPDFVYALSSLTSELVNRGEFDEAISLYKRALIEDPEHVDSSAGLGWCFVKSDRFEEAAEYYSNLLISSPSNINALFFLFEVLRGELQIKLNSKFSYSDNFLKKCLELMSVSRIVAFGDSHVQLFEGCNEIDANHVGASTAYNLAVENSSTGGRRQVLSRVGRMDPMTEAVLLCFGEVDVRANIIKYCYKERLTIEGCVDGVVDRYMSFASEIASRGFKVLIYGGYGAGGDRVSVGSDRERNFAAKCLNASLSAKCEENGFVYFSLHDALLDEENLETDASFLVDGFHLYSSEVNEREQVQTLLFERAFKSAQALFEKKKNQPSRNLVLGNVGVSSSLRVGSLKLGCLCWDDKSDPLESVVIDLGAFIRFESINLKLESDLDANRMNVILDGRLVVVNISRESSCHLHIRPLDQSVPFIGRYPMLKASSDLLLSIKSFSVKELSLI